MGAEDYLLASSILGVLAQRLIRVICPHCKEEQQMEKSVLEEIGFPLDAKTRLYQGQGCKECGKTGFQGRVAIFELMLMDEEIRRLTSANADALKLAKAAIKGGMITLRDDGFEKVKKGITTLSEVLRVTQDL